MDQPARSPKGTTVGTVEVTIQFQDGTIKKLTPFVGEMKGDGTLLVPCYGVENDAGQWIFLPKGQSYTGKRKRRLQELYNL
jgi:hypothetical protein